MFECSKRVRRRLRELAGIAHERELRGRLAELGSSFDRWREGELGTWDLAEEVDQFTKGSARSGLSRWYNTNSLVHLVVAHAIVRGLLTPEEVPAEIRDALGNAIEFYERGLAAGSISFEEEGRPGGEKTGEE